MSTDLATVVTYAAALVEEQEAAHRQRIEQQHAVYQARRFANAKRILAGMREQLTRATDRSDLTCLTAVEELISPVHTVERRGMHYEDFEETYEARFVGPDGAVYVTRMRWTSLRDMESYSAHLILGTCCKDAVMDVYNAGSHLCALQALQSFVDTGTIPAVYHQCRPTEVASTNTTPELPDTTKSWFSRLFGR